MSFTTAIILIRFPLAHHFKDSIVCVCVCANVRYFMRSNNHHDDIKENSGNLNTKLIHSTWLHIITAAPAKQTMKLHWASKQQWKKAAIPKSPLCVSDVAFQCDIDLQNTSQKYQTIYSICSFIFIIQLLPLIITLILLLFFMLENISTWNARGKRDARDQWKKKTKNEKKEETWTKFEQCHEIMM